MADRLKRARKSLDYTQQEIADRLDVHVMSVSGWERGLFEPEPDKLAALAALYGTTPNVLRHGSLAAPPDGQLFRSVAEGPPAHRPILRIMLQAAADQEGKAGERIRDFLEECAEAGAKDGQILAVRSYLLGALGGAILDWFKRRRGAPPTKDGTP